MAHHSLAESAGSFPKLKKRPTIGWLTESLMLPDGAQIWLGLESAARARDINLLSFPGDIIGAQGDYRFQNNILYELAGTQNLDGVIAWGGSIIDFAGVKPETRQAFYNRFRSMPMVNISSIVPGIPCLIGGDNYDGMRQLVTHLVEVHQCRRIAFLQGPVGNSEAEARYQAYVDVLAEHGLPLDLDLVAPGGFSVSMGKAATRILLDERQARFEALIGADDLSILGGLEALRERNIRVPEEVAIAGFDDIEESKFTTPPLTTVRQQFFEMGYQAIALILSLLDGQPVPEVTTLPLTLVVRQSCGCAAQEVTGALATSMAQSGEKFLTAFPTQRDNLVSVLKQVNPAKSMESEIEQMVDSFYSDISGTEPGAFLPSWNQLLVNSESSGRDVSIWHSILSTHRREVLAHFERDEALAKADNLWQQARIMLGEIAEREQAYRRFQMQLRSVTLSRVSQALTTTFDVAELMKILAGELARLGIPGAYLALYEDPQAPTQWSRLRLAYDERGGSPLSAEGYRFPSQQLVPAEFLAEERRFSWIMHALFFREEQMGFVLFELGPLDGIIYEVLHGQLNSALKGAALINELKHRAQELVQSNAELEMAYHRLQENREKLLISEKMASLGRLTAGMAHEMHTPLAAVRIALVELGRLIKEYEQSVDDAQVTPVDHKQIAQEMGEAVSLANDAVKRVVSFIQGIKTQTRTIPEERRPFNAVPVIQDVLALAHHLLQQKRCAAIFELPATEVNLYGSPSQFGQVVTNLLTNAVEARLPDGSGNIHLSLVPKETEVEFKVRDEGCGIPPSLLSRIFEPMFTTKPFGEGTGLGLTIVHDIVTGEFGGTIEAMSQLGQGTTFVLNFPNRPSQLDKH